MYVQRDPTQTYMMMSLSRRSKVQEDLITRQPPRRRVRMFFVCEVGSKFIQRDPTQIYMMMSLSRRSKVQEDLVVRQPPRRRVRMFFVCEVGSKFMQYCYVRTEGSNSDLHDDVTEQKKWSTRGLGRASATKTKSTYVLCLWNRVKVRFVLLCTDVHVDVIEPKGTRGLGRVAATSMFLTVGDIFWF